MQEVILSVRLVDDRSSPAGEEPALGHHDAEWLVPHSMNTWCCEDLAQLGYGSLSEAHAWKMAPYVPCSTQKLSISKDLDERVGRRLIGLPPGQMNQLLA